MTLLRVLEATVWGAAPETVRVRLTYGLFSTKCRRPPNHRAARTVRHLRGMGRRASDVRDSLELAFVGRVFRPGGPHLKMRPTPTQVSSGLKTPTPAVSGSSFACNREGGTYGPISRRVHQRPVVRRSDRLLKWYS